MSASIVGGSKGKWIGAGSWELRWDGLTNVEAAAVQVGFIKGGGDITVDLTVDAGTPTIEIHGTSDLSTAGVPENFKALDDIGGDPISFASGAQGMRVLKPAPRFVKPVFAAGTGTVTIAITVRQSK